MKWLPLSLPLALLLTAAAWAQKPDAEKLGTASMLPGQVTTTPEMWFYEQYMLNYQDPKLAVRQKAEFRSAQRHARMASREWFGFSNARPKVGPDPIHGDYAPHWGSNNSHYPYRWNGIGAAAVVVRPESMRRAY